MPPESPLTHLKRSFAEGLKSIVQRLDGSLEAEKGKDDFLGGVPAIVAAIRAGKIECRVYRKDKFHAKAYITHGRAAVVGSFGLVGSSNFTFPGLCDNVELNVQVRGSEVGLLQKWYERHWEDAEDITPDILRTLERHTDPRTPFEVWFKSLHEFFSGHELAPDEWDTEESDVFPRLAKYQRDAYKNLVQIARRYGGAFLCDGVGLGKTYVGLMLIERFVSKEKKNVVLFAPKAARAGQRHTDMGFAIGRSGPCTLQRPQRYHLQGIRSDSGMWMTVSTHESQARLPRLLFQVM